MAWGGGGGGGRVKVAPCQRRPGGQGCVGSRRKPGARQGAPRATAGKARQIVTRRHHRPFRPFPPLPPRDPPLPSLLTEHPKGWPSRRGIMPAMIGMLWLGRRGGEPAPRRPVRIPAIRRAGGPSRGHRARGAQNDMSWHRDLSNWTGRANQWQQTRMPPQALSQLQWARRCVRVSPT